MLFKFSSVLYFSKYHDSGRLQAASSFSCFQGPCHLWRYLFLLLYNLCDNRPRHFVCCRFSVLFGWTLAGHFLGRVHKIFFFSRCCERKRFFMPLREFVVQFKTRKNVRLTIKTLLFVLNSLKGDNGFENILKWHCRKPFYQLLLYENLTIVVT